MRCARLHRRRSRCHSGTIVYGRHNMDCGHNKRKEDARVEGLKANEEYDAGQRAMREKTARLRALRLARDQAKK